MERIILHCDLNNFFASASLTKCPTLRPLPVAVCGDSEKRHGIVLAKNYVAKSFGVKTAETIWEAKRKCPNLITLPPDFELYEDFSKKARKIYTDYTDKVEPFGIDECWLDISNPDMNFEKAENIANEIRERMKKQLSLTVSVGVSFTKTFAKLGSDMKKPDAVTVIRPDNFKNKIWGLPASDMLMVGKATENALRSMGIFTIGDIAAADTKALKNKLGKNGEYLQKTARGEETSKVNSYIFHSKPKSISHSATAEKDLTDYDEVFSAFLEFSESISKKLKKNSLLAKGIGVHLTTFDFETKEMQMPLEHPTDLAFIIASSALDLFKKDYSFEKPLRAVGVRAIKLTERNQPAEQLSLFESDFDSKLEKIEENLIIIREKYGEKAIKRAACLKQN